jgi:SAM-dependent methyltransferase/uncharacterized membrane protein YbhN (UPF0104 family)
MIGLLLVILLGVALTLGGVATFAWLSDTDAFSLIAEQPGSVAAATAVAVSFTLLNLVLRWSRWNFLLRRFHVRVPTRETFLLFFATLAALLTPFYLGELLRGAAVARRYPALVSVVLWVWLVERCSDVAALLVIWGVASAQPTLVTGGALLLVGAPWLLARHSHGMPQTANLHTAQLATPAIIALNASISLCAWLLPVLSFSAVLSLLGGQDNLLARGTVHFDALALTGGAFASGTLLGGLSGVPGGLSTTGGHMISALQAAGISPAVAAASVLALRFGTQWFAVALGVVLAVTWRRSLLSLIRTSGRVQAHFDALAPAYADNIPEHFRQRMLARKIGASLRVLPAAASETRGLDLGCGPGWYAAELARRGYTMHGIDLSRGQIEQAQRYCAEQGVEVTLAAYDGVHLPYPDAAFDFAYSINVLHHVPGADAQQQLMAEVLRVLKPGGQFLLHEMNVENALFRGYISYVFPLLKSIDEGTELWLRPTRLPRIAGGSWQDEICYFNFFPEFLPELLLSALMPLERWLEASPLRRYSAHYMAVLKRET